MKLSKVLGATRTVSIDLGGETLDVTFRPGAVTPASLARATAAFNENTDERSSQLAAIDLMVQFLGDVLVSWNLTDDDGAELPTSRDTLQLLPIEALARVFAAIQSGDDQLGEAQSTSVAG
jgi:hypothetical protein